MTSLHDLSPRAQEVCEQQGWDDQSLITNLVRFIGLTVPHAGARLAIFFEEAAAEENTPDEDAYNNDSLHLAVTMGVDNGNLF